VPDTEFLSSSVQALADRFEELPRRREEASAIEVLQRLSSEAEKHSGTCRTLLEAIALMHSSGYFSDDTARSCRASVTSVSEEAANAEREVRQQDIQAADNSRVRIDDRIKRALDLVKNARDEAVARIARRIEVVVDELVNCEPEAAPTVREFRNQANVAKAIGPTDGPAMRDALEALEAVVELIEERAQEHELFEHAELLKRVRGDGVRLADLEHAELEWLIQFAGRYDLIIRERVAARQTGRRAGRR